MRRTNIVVTKKFIRNNGDYEVTRSTIPINSKVNDDQKELMNIDKTINSMLVNVTNDNWLDNGQVTKIEYSIEVTQESI